MFITLSKGFRERLFHALVEFDSYSVQEQGAEKTDECVEACKVGNKCFK